MPVSKCLILCLTVATLAACAPERATIESEALGDATGQAATQTKTEEEAAGVESQLRALYGDLGGELRYFDAATDLNDDGQPEVVVHVVSPMLCGTGGCDTLVLTQGEEGYRLVTAISVSRPPIRVSARSTNGWRNLLVHVSGGGIAAHDAELRFDGTAYPDNPTVPPAEPAADTEGAELLIPEFESSTDGKLVSVSGQ